MGKIIFALLEKRLNDTPDRPYLKYRDGEGFKTMKWKEYGQKIEEFSKALVGYGIKAGDKISLIGKSSPDWFVIDMSIMTIGATIAPIYTTSSGEQIKYILNHSGARLFFVEEISQYDKIKGMLKDITGLEKIVLINGTVPSGEDILMDFKTFIKVGNDISEEELIKLRNSVTEDMVATYIYTSGTTGNPKAVMLTQKNCYSTAICVDVWWEFMKRETEMIKTCCFLTLAHVFERSASLLAPLMTGSLVHFCELDNAIEELRNVQPTLVVGLPRTWEKIYDMVMANRNAMPEKKKKIFNWATNVGMQYNKYLYEKKRIPLTLKVKHKIAEKLVIKKILDTLGFFNDAKHVMTGGSVSSKEIIDFFFSLGIWICQVYGQSEALGIGSAETRESLRFGSVGKPFPLTEIKIAADGEIMVKSNMVSPGYYKDKELTAETFRDGWLYSGDLGYLDEDGYLFITGRKKDIIITSGAKNISPAKIEASLMSHPLVEHAVLVGEGKKYITALLTLSLEGGIPFGTNKGISVKSYDDLLNVKGIGEEIEKHISEVNDKLSRVEQIKKFKILPIPLSEEDGELTSLKKIKRFAVVERYEKEINEMYS